MNSKNCRSFAEASQQIQENLNRHLSKYESLVESDESDDDNDDEGSDELLDKLLASYSCSDSSLVSSTKELLKSALYSTSCLICIESIKKSESIWNCGTCYVSLHLTCTQKWSKDSIFLQKQQIEEDPSRNIEINWSCPNCRTVYLPTQVPSRYYCYCKKEEDPKFDPWLTAHSCGEKCGKGLEPKCKHKCILLCHPGYFLISFKI